MSTPKPCPFCGHVGLDFREGSTFRWVIAECAGCGAGIGETRIQTLGDGTKEEWMAIAQQDAIDAWNRRAAVQATQPEAVGWELVPVDATKKMVAAACNVDWSNEDCDGTVHNIWHAMLASAPTPEPMSAPTAEPDGEPKRCTNCDGTGDVHTIDGQWMGRCGCPAGNYPTTPYPSAATPEPSDAERLFDVRPQLTDIDSGAEPSLRTIITSFYCSNGIEVKKAHKFTEDYIDAAIRATKGGKL